MPVAVAPRRRRVAASVVVLAVAASVLLAVPPSASAQSADGLEVELPPNTDCRGAAVIAKTTVVEDAAAANMLAEALRVLSPGGAQRCLLDAGLPPGRGRPPNEAVPPDAVYRSSAGLATTVYVVGGPAAIPNSWLSEQLGVTGFTRVAGADRWQTQQSVAAAMLALAAGSPVQAYDPASVAAATRDLPPNGDCYGTAVLAKLTIAEERAAANMLAAALTAISGDPDSRCLVDVGDPGADRPPSAVAVAEAAQASGAYLLGGEVAVPQPWIEGGFDIRFLERISGPDRWATQSAVAETIVDIAQGSTLPHQYVDDGDTISVYDDRRVNETEAAEIFASGGQERRSTGTFTIAVRYCLSETALDSTSKRRKADSDLKEWVEELNDVVSSFFSRESSDEASFEFKVGEVISISKEDASTAAWTMDFVNEPVDYWNAENSADHSGAPAEQCLQSFDEGYVFIAQDSKGTLGFAAGHNKAISLSPEHKPTQWQFIVAHEVGHAWLDLCHPGSKIESDEQAYDDTPRSAVWRCRPGHTALVHDPFADGTPKKDANGKLLGNEVEELYLCSLMSYCGDRGLPDGRNLGAFIACGQRKLLGWPDGPATPHGVCDDGELKLSLPTPNISSITSDWPATGNRDRPDVLIVYDDSRWPSCVTHVQVAMEKHPTLTNIEREEKWESVSSSQSLRYAVDKDSRYSARLRYRCGSDGIESDWSGKRIFKTPTEPTGAPGRPGKPVLSELDTDFISISWREASGVVAYHEVNWRRADSGSSWKTRTLSNALAIFGTHGLSPAVCYEFRVRAGNGAGASDWSPSAEFCTEEPEEVVMVPDAPGAPNVTPGNGQLSVSWNAPSGNGASVSGYEVQWRRGSGSWDSQTVGATSYTIRGLRNGSRYEVQVRARNSEGWSGWSWSGYGTPTEPRQVGSVRISEGPVNSSRTSAGSCSGNDCYDLSYTIRNLGGGPYTLECWFNGSRAWRGQWSGNASTGCYYSAAFSGSVYVVIDDVKSNTLSISAKASTQQSTEKVTITRGSRNSRSNCASPCYDLDYRIEGLGGGPYTLECWFNGSRAWRGQWSGRASRGCYFSGSFRGTVYVVIDGVKSNTLTF